MLLAYVFARLGFRPLSYRIIFIAHTVWYLPADSSPISRTDQGKATKDPPGTTHSVPGKTAVSEKMSRFFWGVLNYYAPRHRWLIDEHSLYSDPKKGRSGSSFSGGGFLRITLHIVVQLATAGTTYGMRQGKPGREWGLFRPPRARHASGKVL